MRVKICGVRSEWDAELCVRVGADALGFLCGVPPTVRAYIPPSRARQIVLRVPPYVSTVLVTTLSDAESIDQLLNLVPVSTVQLHGPIDVAAVQGLRSRWPHLKLVKTIPVGGPESIREALAWGSSVDSLLLDTRGEGHLGGTGRTHDWDVSRRIVHAVGLPVILAGGLSPENVGEAVRAVHPFAVDANSGVVGLDGSKDPGKVARFIGAARAAE